MLTEERIISLLEKTLGSRAKGIGDDCAVLPLPGARKLLATTDMLIEGVDFDFRYCSFSDVGYKSVMVNLSDIAAMGGRPSSILVSLGIPGEPSPQRIRALYHGMEKALTEAGCIVAGGDLSAAPAWTISICALGEAVCKPKLRSDARPGHIVGLVGRLGWSAAGLQLLRATRLAKKQKKVPGSWRKFIQQHLRPQAQINAGRILGNSAHVAAMIDVSDGLSTDLGRICKASECGATLDAHLLSCERALCEVCNHLGVDPLELMLNGGEDYALLFTCKPRAFPAIATHLGKNGVPVAAIGSIMKRSDGLRIRDAYGASRPLIDSGFDHFK